MGIGRCPHHSEAGRDAKPASDASPTTIPARYGVESTPASIAAGRESVAASATLPLRRRHTGVAEAATPCYAPARAMLAATTFPPLASDGGGPDRRKPKEVGRTRPARLEMIVPDDIRKCVAFLGHQMPNGQFQLFGSVFWIGEERKDSKKIELVYAVTARHVVDAIRQTGAQEVWFRVNRRGGDAKWIKSNLTDWYVHPSDSTLDVAVLKTSFAADWDHLAVPYSLCITEERMKEHAVGLGDEVFITGLFIHHHGSSRNIPIVRVGNLACMTEEKIVTKRGGLMDAFLIEARSIGGLSGSPVFLNLGVMRLIGRQLKHASGGPIFYMLGLVHGHYDVESIKIATSGIDDIDSSSAQQVNTGIAIVVPFHSIRAVIEAYEHART